MNTPNTLMKLSIPTTTKVVPMIKLTYLAAFRMLTPKHSVSPGDGAAGASSYAPPFS